MEKKLEKQNKTKQEKHTDEVYYSKGGEGLKSRRLVKKSNMKDFILHMQTHISLRSEEIKD